MFLYIPSYIEDIIGKFGVVGSDFKVIIDENKMGLLSVNIDGFCVQRLKLPINVIDKLSELTVNILQIYCCAHTTIQYDAKQGQNNREVSYTVKNHGDTRNVFVQPGFDLLCVSYKDTDG